MIYISYFYKVRFFHENVIPFSTALGDPAWFHDFKGKSHIFVDKRGVYNGLRIEELSPYKLQHIECKKGCTSSPSNCSFIRAYEDYLNTLDFNEIMKKLDKYAKVFKEQRHLEKDPDICLLVHEKPDNLCSERGPLIKWFKKNGISLMEY